MHPELASKPLGRGIIRGGWKSTVAPHCSLKHLKPLPHPDFLTLTSPRRL